MFSDIIEQIRARNFEEAIAALLPLYDDADVKVASYAGYLLGYINTLYAYDGRDLNKARTYLRGNIYGQYPHHHAYVLYSRIEEDENIAINHLNMGLKKYPDDAEILFALPSKSPEKSTVIDYIYDNNKVDDTQLMGKAIACLFAEKKWSKIRDFIVRIEDTGKIDDDEQLYLDLINAYACIFQDDSDYAAARDILETLVTRDVDNKLTYSHFLGLIYTLIGMGEEKRAIGYFDRLPVNNSIMDFDERPFVLGLELNFAAEYNTIFSAMFNLFSQDGLRKLKAQVLYALYLYHPSGTYAVCRYKKSDAAVLTRYLKTKFNPKIAAVLYDMRCHFGQYKEAYDVLWLFPKKSISPEDYWLYLSDTIENADLELLNMLVNETVLHLDEDNYNEEIFGAEIFIPLVEKLYESRMYSEICRISEYLSDDLIVRCGCAFKCAFSYSKENNERTLILYEKLVEEEPYNASAINNLGVKYREQGKFFRALCCYERASRISPEEELYKENLKKIKKSIQTQMAEELEAVADGISIDSLQAIGYTVDLCKRVFVIQDEKLREIIQRDLRECAIAVVAGQDKLAAIMCGSIAEALLLYRIRDKGITAYNVIEVSKSKEASNLPISKMALNEFLYVAYKENIISKSDYNLGHYIRNYRNMIHPDREIREKETVSHENVTTIWAVLIKLLSELFPD